MTQDELGAKIVDWNNLRPQDVGLIGAVAALASSAVAATAALVSTLVAGWNGRRLEARAAIRAYRLQRLQSSIDEAESRIRGVALVRYHNQSARGALYPGGQEPIGRKIFVTPSDELHDAATEFAIWDHWCWSIFSGREGREPSDIERDWLLNQLERSSLTLGEAIENFVFGKRFTRRLSKGLLRERLANKNLLKALLRNLAIENQPTGESTSVGGAV